MVDNKPRKEPPSVKVTDAEMKYVFQIVENLRSLEATREVNMRVALDHIKWLYERETPEYKQCEEDLGWLFFLTAQSWYSVYHFLKEHGQTATWEMIEGWFDNQEGIESILSRAKEVTAIGDRLQIIEKGLRAHVSGDYIVSISILLPQIEGTIWDLGVAKGVVDPSWNSRVKLDKNRKPIIRPGKRKPEEWDFTELVYELWGYETVKKRVKEDYYSPTFRHPILHGRDIQHFDKRRSTEVVMLILSVIEQAAAMRL